MNDSVEVRAGALADLDESSLSARATLLVTDRNVEPLVPRALAGLPRHVIEPGETSKSWDELGRLLASLDAAGLDRDGLVLALGGGVVTDLAGLAASLHRRGVAWWAIPTSLVGQVDAAVGGKTAVNLGGGKNTVGSFHLPERVVVDPSALASLPTRHLAAGFAEVLKSALIAGGALFDDASALAAWAFTSADPSAIEVIGRCLEQKLRLVEDDLHDHGARRLLNLGHTFGHAFEALAMPDLLHGEAVGLGLLCAARFGAGEPDGPLETSVRRILLRWGLPLSVEWPADAVLDEMRRDKKRAAGRTPIVSVSAPGRVELVTDPPRAAIVAALAAVRPV